MDAELELLREFRNFVIDICYDYRQQPEIGLMAIRVLAKGKMDEDRFRETWERWKEKMNDA